MIGFPDSMLQFSFQLDVPKSYNGVEIVNITRAEVKESSGAYRLVPLLIYRVTILVVPNFPLTTKQKFRFSMRPMY